MNLGRLRVVKNNEGAGRSNKRYNHVLVQSSRGLETLVLTDRELDTVRLRSLKNSDDVSSPTLLDRALAWLLSFVG